MFRNPARPAGNAASTAPWMKFRISTDLPRLNRRAPEMDDDPPPHQSGKRNVSPPRLRKYGDAVNSAL
jgi:hypothetical protein